MAKSAKAAPVVGTTNGAGATTEDIALILERYQQPGQLVRARLEGVAPGLLMHSGEAMQKADIAKTAAKAKGLRGKYIPEADVEATWGAYQHEDGILYLPTENLLRSCTEAGGAFQVEGKRYMMKKILPGLLDVPLSVGVGFPLLDPNSGEALRKYEVDVRRVRVGTASVMRARPLIKEWAAEVEFLLDLEGLSVPLFAAILGYAGARKGIGDFRPEKGGQFGRFRVTEFTVED